MTEANLLADLTGEATSSMMTSSFEIIGEDTGMGSYCTVLYADWQAATTRVIRTRSYYQPLELSSGTLTGDPMVSADGVWAAMRHAWSEQDRAELCEMFLPCTFSESLPVDFNGVAP
jgi:hypothetical protein